MYRPIVSMFLSLVAGTCMAQVRPPVLPAAAAQQADPSMVVVDRGMKLEVSATERAVPLTDAKDGDPPKMKVLAANNSTAIHSHQLGVVYNHSLQVQGFITGEIAFKLKGDLQADGSFVGPDYPGLEKITSPNVYVVVARNPAEFVSVLKRLQSRQDLEWVEPTIVY
jgi:hypothetical protein